MFPILIVHRGRLTWNLRIHLWKRKNIFQTIMFGFYVDTSVLPSRGEYKFTVQALGMGKGMFSRKISLTNRGPGDAMIEQIV